MKKFYPQTWSMESIAPVWNGAFRKDLTKVVDDLYQSMVPLADEDGAKKRIQITMGLKQAFRNNKKKLSELLSGLIDCVKKHTNLEIEKAFLDLTPEINASAGTETIVYIFATKVWSKVIVSAISRDKESLDDFIDTHKVAMTLDRATGKFRKEAKVKGKIVINSAFFDKVYNGTYTIDTIVDTIMHEIGHVFDSYDSALRMSWVSDLAEDLVDYKEGTFGVAEAEEALARVSKILPKMNLGFGGKVKRAEFTKIVDKLNKETNRDEDWVSTVSAVYTLVVRSAEYNITSRGFQDIFSNDTYKAPERRADKYATLQGGGHGDSLFIQSMVDYTKLMEVYGINKFRAKHYIKESWLILRQNEADYDTHADRIGEVLRTMYYRLDKISKIAGPDGVKEDLEALEFVRKIYEESLHSQTLLEESMKFLDAYRKYSNRALAILFSRSRLEENSILMTAIRNTARSSLHADAAHLQQLAHQ